MGLQEQYDPSSSQAEDDIPPAPMLINLSACNEIARKVGKRVDPHHPAYKCRDGSKRKRKGSEYRILSMQIKKRREIEKDRAIRLFSSELHLLFSSRTSISTHDILVRWTNVSYTVFFPQDGAYMTGTSVIMYNIREIEPRARRVTVKD